MYNITDKGHQEAQEIEEARSAGELVLIILEESGELPDSVLSRKTGISHRKLAKVCEGLRNAGLVEGSPDGFGARIVQSLRGRG